ncbi:MAG: cupin domain-containing protein [Barrevirus sp.]|uniref:Cupin domain-containing protein n=1 Tax=Barrevirus sp. TaxID=2487763 RepID=A0A3G4ZR01_9VIRU|nr:MAG: cupin domain-containing protein [Barrevirus sp.]
MVLMRLRPGVEIGMELHDDVDQFIRVEKGLAKYSKNGQKVDININTSIPSLEHNIIYDKDMRQIGKVINPEQGDLPQDHVLLVPRNTWHNVWNPANPANSEEDVHIYTLYSFSKQNSPHRKDMEVQKEKADEPNEKH